MTTYCITRTTHTESAHVIFVGDSIDECRAFASGCAYSNLTGRVCETLFVPTLISLSGERISGPEFSSKDEADNFDGCAPEFDGCWDEVSGAFHIHESPAEWTIVEIPNFTGTFSLCSK